MYTRSTSLTFETLNYEVYAAEKDGKIILAHDNDTRTDHVISDEGTDAKLVRFRNHPWQALMGDAGPEVSCEVIEGLRICGVTRRHGVLRRFVECPVAEFQTGDKVVLQDEEGAKYKTLKLNSIAIPSSA